MTMNFIDGKPNRHDPKFLSALGVLIDTMGKTNWDGWEDILVAENIGTVGKTYW